HPHYDYKLRWLEALRAEGARELAEDLSAKVALVGDFNVAPLDEDVWDMEFFDGKTHVSEPERAAFRAVVDAGYADVVRGDHPGPGVYTYWDYQQLRFPKRQGMRIDFLLGSPSVQSAVTGSFIGREERKRKGASDHAPVVVDLDLCGRSGPRPFRRPGGGAPPRPRAWRGRDAHRLPEPHDLRHTKWSGVAISRAAAPDEPSASGSGVHVM